MTIFLKQTLNPLLSKLKGIEGQTWVMLGLFVVMFLSLIEPSFADMFADATTKAKDFKTGLIGFGKVVALVAFVCSVFGGFTGRMAWSWTGWVVGITLILIAVDKIATFVGMG